MEFKFISKNGVEMSSIKNQTDEGTIFYSNGDRYEGSIVDGV